MNGQCMCKLIWNMVFHEFPPSRHIKSCIVVIISDFGLLLDMIYSDLLQSPESALKWLVWIINGGKWCHMVTRDCVSSSNLLLVAKLKRCSALDIVLSTLCLAIQCSTYVFVFPLILWCCTQISDFLFANWTFLFSWCVLCGVSVCGTVRVWSLSPPSHTHNPPFCFCPVCRDASDLPLGLFLLSIALLFLRLFSNDSAVFRMTRGGSLGLRTGPKTRTWPAPLLTAS